jgi:hypothetical protein
VPSQYDEQQYDEQQYDEQQYDEQFNDSAACRLGRGNNR